jgi:chemotaxis protein methyltransferase CheR
MTNDVAPQVFAILRTLIEERTGLAYAPGDDEIVRDKIKVQAQDAGFDSLLDYYYFLRYDTASQAEFSALVDALVVNETYFFRELPQLEVLVDEIIVPRVRAGRRPRVWSAACSTGEEPLTLAMLLADRGVLDQTYLLATDISDRALARARAGEHNTRALRSDFTPAAARYIELDRGRPRVDPRVSSFVNWKKLNLLDATGVAQLGAFDAILCRNVLIYFSEQTIERVVASLVSALEPSGVLLVGITESLLRFSAPLGCEERRGIFLYRKTSHEADQGSRRR